MKKNKRETEEQKQGQPAHEPQPGTSQPTVTKHRFTSSDNVEFLFHVDHDQQKVYLEGKDGLLRYSGNNVTEVSSYPLAEDSPKMGGPQPPFPTDLPPVPLAAINDPDSDQDPAVVDGRMVKDVPSVDEPNKAKTKLDNQIREDAKKHYAKQGAGKARVMNKKRN